MSPEGQGSPGLGLPGSRCDLREPRVTHAQTHAQTVTHTHKHTVTHTHKHTVTHAHTHTNKQTVTHTHRTDSDTQTHSTQIK